MAFGNKSNQSDRLDLNWDTTSGELQRSPRGARLLLWTIVLALVAAVAWANRAELDEVVSGTGKVIPSRQMQVIQNLEGGILAELLVAEGDIVEVGQVLLRIDDTQFSSSLDEKRLIYLQSAATAARFKAEAEGEEIDIPQEVVREEPSIATREIAIFASRQAEHNSKLIAQKHQITQRAQRLAELSASKMQLEQGYALVKRELDLTAPLVNLGAVSEVELLRLKREVVAIQGEIQATELAIPRVRSSREEAKQLLEELDLSFRSHARQRLTEVLADLAQLTARNVALKDRASRTAVRSPVRGTINQVMIHTVGGVITPGMDLVEIVPLEDNLLIEAQITPADIAFLHPGLDATVQFTAYDFSIYGGLPAQLEHISADSIVDEKGDSYYLVRVRTDQTHLGTESDPLPIIPGMTANIDILTGKKTVLSYLLKPMLLAKSRAFTER